MQVECDALLSLCLEAHSELDIFLGKYKEFLGIAGCFFFLLFLDMALRYANERFISSGHVIRHHARIPKFCINKMLQQPTARCLEAAFVVIL